MPHWVFRTFIVRTKVSFQEMCAENVDWDDELNGDLLAKWNTMLDEIDSLDNVQIPRCYNTPTIQPTKTESHSFWSSRSLESLVCRWTC